MTHATEWIYSRAGVLLFGLVMYLFLMLLVIGLCKAAARGEDNVEDCSHPRQQSLSVKEDAE